MNNRSVSRNKMGEIILVKEKTLSSNAKKAAEISDDATLEPGADYTGKAYIVERTATFLAMAYELTIVDGIVIKKRLMNNGEDMPAIMIAKAEEALWRQYRGRS